jgi:hypothetical protein
VWCGGRCVRHPARIHLYVHTLLTGAQTVQKMASRYDCTRHYLKTCADRVTIISRHAARESESADQSPSTPYVPGSPPDTWYTSLTCKLAFTDAPASTTCPVFARS